MQATDVLVIALIVVGMAIAAYGAVQFSPVARARVTPRSLTSVSPTVAGWTLIVLGIVVAAFSGTGPIGMVAAAASAAATATLLRKSGHSTAA